MSDWQRCLEALGLMLRRKPRFGRKPRFVRDVQRLQLQPGDVILVRIARETSSADAGRIAEAMEDAVPKHRCLVLHDDVTVAAIGDHPAFRDTA